jgi:hypothetical protein
MRTYVISGIAVERGEVEWAAVSILAPRPDGRAASLRQRVAMHYSDIASLAASQDVYVAKWVCESDEYELGSRVSTQGKGERLVSLDAEGRPNEDLFALPRIDPAGSLAP